MVGVSLSCKVCTVFVFGVKSVLGLIFCLLGVWSESEWKIAHIRAWTNGHVLRTFVVVYDEECGGVFVVL